MALPIESPAFDPKTCLAPSSFPHPVCSLTIRETYLSWVVLTGPFAYKVKKPVKLPFIDSSTLALRRELCGQELVLNRRLAPALYVDVVAISRGPDGHHIGADGNIVEYAVRMHQFDPSRQLDGLLDTVAVTAWEVVDLADQLANFHGCAPVAAGDMAVDYAARFRAAALGNLATLLAHLPSTDGAGDLGRLIDWTDHALLEYRDLLGRRQTDGRIRECHGDLHAGNIVRWRGRLVAFDCIEFNAAFRWIDVMDDAAFLVMDLISHGRPDLAFRFLDRYLERTGDYPGVRLLRLYSVNRAMIRAMVDSVSAGTADAAASTGRGYSERLHRRLATAAGWLDQPAPTLYMMHGKSGSGKSWLSEQLVGPLHAVRVRSDVERRREPPADAGAPCGDPYAPAQLRRTYARLAGCAESCLAGGVDVIVDATFLDRSERQLFEALAAGLRSNYLIIDCEADLATLRRRLDARRTGPGNVSDADEPVLQRQFELDDGWDAEERDHVLTARTMDPDVVARFLSQLPSNAARAPAMYPSAQISGR